MGLFYKTTSVKGGKLYFNDTEVKKLYFGDELVYEGSLPKGTVISNGADLGSGVGIVYAETIGVNSDWSNVNSDISLYYRVQSADSTKVFTKDELMKGVTVGGSTQSLSFTLLNSPARIFINCRDPWGCRFYRATLV